jgi:hypothetical protein
MKRNPAISRSEEGNMQGITILLASTYGNGEAVQAVLDNRRVTVDPCSFKALNRSRLQFER